MRVPSFLSDQNVAFETIVHPPAYTASKRASRLHVSGKQLAKCVLLTKASAVDVGSDLDSGPRITGTVRYILAVLQGTDHVDLEAVAYDLDGPVRASTTEEIHEIFRDCEWGSLVPFGSLYGLPTMLEDSFNPEDVLVFEAHLHAIAIRMSCRDYERLEKPRRLAFACRR
jgi:Ala-tRNA(Pro) deacylase